MQEQRFAFFQPETIARNEDNEELLFDNEYSVLILMCLISIIKLYFKDAFMEQKYRLLTNFYTYFYMINL